METLKVNILSIDAWRDGGKGWYWNQWHTIEENLIWEEFTPRKMLKRLREIGVLSDYSKGKVSLEDDGYNYVIQKKSTMEPLYAIEYGCYWEENGL